jgi:AraC family transcriptional regulator, arabinose operon regulatory protein
MQAERRCEGFAGQRLIVVPRSITRRAAAVETLAPLFPTDVGWYPKCSGHYKERPEGCSQAIVIYCLTGRGACSFPSGVEYGVGPDQALFIPPYCPHAYWSDDDDPWTIHWVHFQGSLASEWSGAEASCLPASPSSRASICSLFEELEWALDMGFSLMNLERGAGALHHLLSVLRFDAQRTTSCDDRIEEVLRFMEGNLQLRVGLGELAGRARYSVSHFVALFGERTGSSPLEFWKRLRMREACRLLDEGGFPVSEISFKLGFEDPLYFSRTFRNTMGVSPRAYASRDKG